MIQFVAQRMMEFNVEGLCGAGFDVKSGDRVTAATATVIVSGKPVLATLIEDHHTATRQLFPELSGATAYCRKDHGSGHSVGYI